MELKPGTPLTSEVTLLNHGMDEINTVTSAWKQSTQLRWTRLPSLQRMTHLELQTHCYKKEMNPFNEVELTTEECE